MTEEQVQTLSKLITKREQRAKPASPHQPAVIASNESVAVPFGIRAEVGAVDANSRQALAEIEEVSSDVQTHKTADVTINKTSTLVTIAVDISESRDR
jgi:hypothetical protein